MIKHCKVLLFVFLVLFFLSPLSAFSNEIYVSHLDGDTINPVTAKYIVHSIEKAEQEAAECLIIELDTPGGLLESTRTIVKKMLTSKVPVVVYIAPNGSRAGSAGVFITYASHIAAMAPSTNIGAAHPIELGKEDPKGNDNWKELKEILKDFRNQDEKETAVPVKDVADKKTAAPAFGGAGTEDVDKSKNKNKSVKSAPAGEDSEKQQEATEEPEEDLGILENKILQDTTAFIRAIAKERNRNVEWAVESVTKSSSITAEEALEKKVVELIAKNQEDLLNQLDGKSVVIEDKTIILQTKDALIKKIEMTSAQRFFNVLANPNIAYILLVLGFYGIFFELLHPGSAVPGVLGAIFLILAFYSMQTLPTNYAGLGLLILGLVLWVAEAFTSGFGLLALGGLVCTFLGSMLLFEAADPVLRVSPAVIWAMIIPMVLLICIFVPLILKSRYRKAMGGQEGLIGKKGAAQSDFGMERQGKIYVHGELWNALSDEKIKKGEKVIVVEIDGLTLKVKKQ